MATAPLARADQPALISLAGVAALAHVRRPVASMWRSRFRDGDTPFPAAVTQHDGRDVFDADQVAAWLERTAHGNNPDAVSDLASAVDIPPMPQPPRQTDDAALPDASPATNPMNALEALVALRAAIGEPLTEHDPDELASIAARVDPGDLCLYREVRSARASTADADRLVDACYTPAAALARVHDRRRAARRADGSAGPLHIAARHLVVRLVVRLADAASPRLRLDPGVDADLLRGIIDELGDNVDVQWPSGPRGRVLRRVALCAGLPNATQDVPGAAGGTPVVVLDRLPHTPAARTADVLRGVDDIALTLGDNDCAVLVAPARVLADPLRGADAQARADVLRTRRLRAVVRLDAGLVGSASREPLAVWVFGPHADVPVADRVVAVADLTAVPLTDAAVGDIIADIAAALHGPAQARARAFRFATLRRTSSLLAGPEALTAHAAPRTRTRANSVGEIAALADATLRQAGADAPAARWHATPRRHTTLPSISVADAVAARHVRIIAGTRIHADELGPTGLPVITAADLDTRAGRAHPHPGRAVGHVDPLAFVARHPAAPLTRPGDVVFRTAPTACAWLDSAGGHVVAAPARVLRISAADPGGLVPELVVADIAAGASGPGAHRRWMLRRVAPAQIAPLRAALAHAAASRAALAARITALDDATAALTDAVIAGAVTLDPSTEH